MVSWMAYAILKITIDQKNLLLIFFTYILYVIENLAENVPKKFKLVFKGEK